VCQAVALGASFHSRLCGAARGRGSYDSFLCAKGASSAPTPALHAHFAELKWAVQHGVPASLVRVSIGLEDAVWLYKMFADTSKAAKARNDRGGVNNRPLTSLRRSAINAHPTSNCSVLVVLAPSDWVCTAGKSKEGWLVRCVAVRTKACISSSGPVQQMWTVAGIHQDDHGCLSASCLPLLVSRSSALSSISSSNE
jgi:hypothetical protein